MLQNVVYCIGLARNRDRSRTSMSTVRNCRCSVNKRGIFFFCWANINRLLLNVTENSSLWSWVRFEFSTAVTMKNGVSWMLRSVALVRIDVSEELCISSQTASVSSYGYIPTSPILVTLMMEALSSCETSVITRATWRNIPDDAILNTTSSPLQDPC
jgi:hypothetical protein